MKIGDLVKWHTDLYASPRDREDTGLVVDGPRDGSNGRGGFAISYEVAWFDAKTTFWHNDEHLEVLSESR